MGNINNSEREYKGREKKCVGNIRNGDRTERLLTLGNTLRVVEGEVEGMGDWVTGTEEGTSWDERWVLCYMLAN